MQIRLLKYTTDNIGDFVQTIAVAQHIGNASEYIERDELNLYDGEECAVVMNGWFSHKPENWPPSDRITPIFFGFHMTSKASIVYAKHKDYFKRFEPIGCRDKGTADILKTWGVEAYVSGCATMTFPTRSNLPIAGHPMLVDVDPHILKRKERRDSIVLSHIMPAYWGSMETKTKINTTEKLLEFYRNKATHIITSRIHCAMPCFAMGIPTIYSGIKEYRTDLIGIIGLPNAKLPSYVRKPLAELPFSSPNFDDKKKAIADDLRARLTAHGIELAKWNVKN